MPRRPQPTPTNPAVEGCSFKDVLKWTDASRSNLIYWTDRKIIIPDLEDTAGPGHPRRFSLLNVLEVQLAAEMHKFPLPASLIGDALWSFHWFHDLSMSLRPVEAGQQRLTPVQRAAAVEAYVRSAVRRDERHGVKGTKKQIGAYTATAETVASDPEQEALMLHHAACWPRFIVDSRYRIEHFYGLFINPDDEVAEIIDEPINIREAIGVTTVVISLGGVIDYLNDIGGDHLRLGWHLW